MSVNFQQLARVRELMRLKMNASAADALKSAPLDLQALGSGSNTHEEHQLLLRVVDAAGSLVSRNFLGIFEHHVQENFDEKIGWLTQAASANSGHVFAEFDLLDDAVLNQQMALRKLVQKTLEELDRSALLAVEIRMSEVLGVTKVEGTRNPIGPGTIFKSMRQALEEIVEDEKVRDTLVNVFQPHLSAGLNALYSELNAMLIEAGVRPDYRPLIERQAMGPQAARKSAAGVTISQAMSLRDLMPGNASSPIDLSAILGALLQGAAVNRKYGARMLADQEGTLYAQALDTQVNPQLLAALSEMQAAAALPQGGEHRAQDLQSVVQHMQKAEEHPLDQLTGELVAVVFDFLLNEKSLAESVKTQLARLQIVALKAALLDRSFFARREHPLRILLDDISRKGSDPLIDASEQSEFIVGLSLIVDDLLAQFDRDLSLFEQARQRLNVLGEVKDQALEQKLNALADTLLVEEREAQAEAQANDAVRAALRPDTPEFLRTFLERHWRRVLMQARLQSEDNQEWEAAVQNMETLLSSVYPRPRQDLSRFAASLPPLIGNLQKNLRRLQLPEEEKQPFLDALMQAHTSILQGARANIPVPEVEASKLKAEPDSVPFQAAEYRPTQRALLQQGAVVEFSDLSPPARARLSWISPARTRYVFVAALGAPRSFTAEELSLALAQGVVQVQDEESPFGRALAEVMGEEEAT